MIFKKHWSLMSYQLDTKTLVDLMMLYTAIFFSDLCTKEAVGFYTLGRKLNEVKVEKVSIFNEFPKPFSLRCSSLHVCNSLTCLGLYVVREREKKKILHVSWNLVCVCSCWLT